MEHVTRHTSASSYEAVRINPEKDLQTEIQLGVLPRPKMTTGDAQIICVF
jgi:hypothetical protein